MRELFDFAKPLVKIPSKHLNCFTFYSDLHNLTSFEEFLLSDRISNFLLLSIIDSLNKEFVVLHESSYEIDYSAEIDEEIEEYPEIDLGMARSDKIFTKEELFSNTLFHLELSQIICEPLCAQKVFERMPSINDHPHCSREIIVATDGSFIFKDDKFYYEDKNLETCFEFYKEKAKELFEYAKGNLVLSHDIYIKWLLAWFPGKIKIRMLE